MQFLKKFSRHLLKISLVLALFAPSFIFVAEPASAADATCACYCGDTKNGAVKQSAPQSSLVECTALCNGQKLTPIGCYVGSTALPENDGKCWTEDECAKYATDRDGTSTPGTWGGQSEKCAETKSGLATGYCYSPAIGVNLNIPILGHATVMGFNEYLALAYKFLLPAMSLIAVVMVMVGGLEYVIAGGSSKRIDKAKTRITNALIGLVLLMAAYAIASLLDPRLVNLNALKMPLVKRVILIDPKASCEYLQDMGFKVDPSSEKTCGNQGTISGLENVRPEAKNSNWKLQDKCQYIRCTDGLACMSSGEKASCVMCSNINTINATAGLTPSVAVCSAAQSIADQNDKDIDHKYFCEFDDGGYEGLGGFNTCVSADTTGSVNPSYIDCNTVRSDAQTGDPCLAYDKVNILHPKMTDFNSVTINKVFGYDFSHAINVCVSDPCGVAAATGNKCNFAYIDGTGQTIYHSLTLGVGNYFTGAIDNHCVSAGGYKPPPEELQQPNSSGPGNFSTP